MTSPQPVSEVPTVEIPAAEYDEALAFCNARLKEQDKEPIAALPPGKPRETMDCPCSRACGVWVGDREWHPRGDSAHLRELPDGVMRFVAAFDLKAAPNGTTGPVTLPIRATQAPAGGKVQS